MSDSTVKGKTDTNLANESTRRHEALVQAGNCLARLLRAFVRYQKQAKALHDAKDSNSTICAMTEAIAVHLHELYLEIMDELERGFARKLHETNHPLLLRVLDHYYTKSSRAVSLPNEFSSLLDGLRRRDRHLAVSRVERQEIDEAVTRLFQRDPECAAMKNASAALVAALATTKYRWRTLPVDAFEEVHKLHGNPVIDDLEAEQRPEPRERHAGRKRPLQATFEKKTPSLSQRD